MSKPKPKPPPTYQAGLYKAESVKVRDTSLECCSYHSFSYIAIWKDVAESLGLPSLPDAVATALASDVEYRIHQVVEVYWHLMLPANLAELMRLLRLRKLLDSCAMPSAPR